MLHKNSELFGIFLLKNFTKYQKLGVITSYCNPVSTAISTQRCSKYFLKVWHMGVNCNSIYIYNQIIVKQPPQQNQRICRGRCYCIKGVSSASEGLSEAEQVLLRTPTNYAAQEYDLPLTGSGDNDEDSSPLVFDLEDVDYVLCSKLIVTPSSHRSNGYTIKF